MQGQVPDEFRLLYESVIDAPEFQRAPQRAALLKYLWESWDGAISSERLWKDVLDEQSRKRLKQGKPRGDVSEKNQEEAVRQACLDVRKELQKHFSEISNGWIIDLPLGVPGQGYRLEFLRLNDPESPAMAFWQAHLYPSCPLYVVYTEQLFYQYWPERFTFRYYDLNAENKL